VGYLTVWSLANMSEGPSRCPKLFLIVAKKLFMDLGQVIKSRRQKLRLTQQSLADMSGVSVRMVKSIEGNYANPSLKTVEKLLAPLGLHIEILENA